MDTIPDVTLAQMKVIKTNLMDNLITPTLAEELGNAARLVCSWLDGILEFTILKHEGIVLRLKNLKVLDKIKAISDSWPKRKEFIEGAYKILLFTKQQRRQVSHALVQLRNAVPEFTDFRMAMNRVLKVWYERRIDEENQKNKRLRELHESLTRKQLEMKQHEMNASAETQSLITGQQVTNHLQHDGDDPSRHQELMSEIESLRA